MNEDRVARPTSLTVWRVIAVVWGVIGVGVFAVFALALWALTVTWGDSFGSGDFIWVAVLGGLMVAVVVLAVMMWRGSVLARYLAGVLTLLVAVRWLTVIL